MEQTQTKPNVVVIGAGIVGVSTACELSKNGYNVTVIERYKRAAQFCSMGNIGVSRDHTYDHSFKSIKSKYASSSFYTQAIKSFLIPGYKPTYYTNVFVDKYFFTDLTSFKWTYLWLKSLVYKYDKHQYNQYEKYCYNAFKSNISQTSYKGYAKVFSPATNASSIYQHAFANLKLMQFDESYTSQSPEPFRNTYSAADTATDSDVHVEIHPDSYATDCHSYSNKIVNKFENNINFMFNTDAKRILIDKNNRIYGVEIDENSVILADKVVVCGGVLTNNIIQNKIYKINDKMDKKQLNFKLPFIPIIPLQGYSITCPLNKSKCEYKYPCNVYVFEPFSIYASRMSDKFIRFGNYGYFRSIKYATSKWNEMNNELESREGIQCNVNKDVNTKFENLLWDNLENCIKENVLEIYGIDHDEYDKNKIRWTGFRPFTPDRLPIVGMVSSKVDGLYINAGHGTLGWSWAHGTAKLLARLINNNLTSEENDILQMISIDRF